MTAITTANVFEAFDQAAARYDLMVGLNPGYHGHLRSAAEALAERLPTGTARDGEGRGGGEEGVGHGQPFASARRPRGSIAA